MPPCNVFCWQMLLLSHRDSGQGPHTPCRAPPSNVNHWHPSATRDMLLGQTVPVNCQTPTLDGIRMSPLFLNPSHTTQKSSSSSPTASGESRFHLYQSSALPTSGGRQTACPCCSITAQTENPNKCLHDLSPSAFPQYTLYKRRHCTVLKTQPQLGHSLGPGSGRSLSQHTGGHAPRAATTAPTLHQLT